MTPPASPAPEGALPLTSALLHPAGAPTPPWAQRLGAWIVTPDSLARAEASLAWVGCILLDATLASFIVLARRAHALDPAVQVVAVTPPERVQATRRALLYAPGLGEVWIASPTDVTGALAERAAGVTRQRRRYERTRQRLARDRVATSPQRAERALISDAWLAGLLRVLPDPVLSVDSGGRILSTNAAADAAFAGVADGLMGVRLADALALEPEPGGDGALLERAARHGHVLVHFTDAVGASHTAELRAAPMQTGEVDAWAVLLRDVTEQLATLDRLQDTAAELEAANEELQSTTEELMQRTAEAEAASAALRESEGTYRALADAIPTLAWTARADGFIDWYNQRWYEYTGTAPAQMEGWGWQAVHDPAVLPDVMAGWTASIATGAPFEMTFPLRGADGRFRAFLTRVVPLRDARGEVTRWFGTNTDVEAERTSRVRVERLQALTEALAGTQSLDEVAAVVVAQLVAEMGARTGMLAVRPPGAAEATLVRQTGLSAMVVRRYQQFPVTAPGPAAECLRTGVPIFVEARDGEQGLLARFPEIADVWESLGTHAVASVPLTAGGAVVGAMSFTFDAPRSFAPPDRAFFVSLARQAAQAVERVRLFAAERTARERADEANRSKSQFLATMSHELRTPLNAISGHVSLVLEEIYGTVTPAQRGALERVLRAQGHLLGLINDVLSFARLESGRLEYHVVRVAMADVLGDILPLVEPQLTSKGLAFEVRLPEQRGEAPVYAMADRDKLGQVLVNLLSNAIKFTGPGGRIAVEVDVARGGAAVRPQTVELRVHDTGIGVPADKLAAIFEPFVQVHGELTRTREGTGLGLAISRDLARGMGGDLAVQSEAGAGSTFTVYLPRADG